MPFRPKENQLIVYLNLADGFYLLHSNPGWRSFLTDPGLLTYNPFRVKTNLYFGLPFTENCDCD